MTIARDLQRLDGILGGSSSGTLLAEALRYCQAQTVPKRVVTSVCDSGNKRHSRTPSALAMYYLPPSDPKCRRDCGQIQVVTRCPRPSNRERSPGSDNGLLRNGLQLRPHAAVQATSAGLQRQAEQSRLGKDNGKLATAAAGHVFAILWDGGNTTNVIENFSNPNEWGLAGKIATYYKSSMPIPGE